MQRPVDQPLRDGARDDRVEQWLSEGVDGRQLDVDSAGQGQCGGVGAVLGHAVQRREEGDAEVVGDDRAGEPPGVPQQLGEQGLVGGGGQAVGVGVGGHDRAGPAFADGHLEGRQDDVGAFARAHRDGGEVASGAGGGVPREVLEGGDDPGRLQALDVGGGDGADQVRVLADRLLDPPPAGVADHVEHRREALVHPDGPQVAPDGGGHRPDQLRVEGGAPGQRHGVGGGSPGGEAGQALLVGQGRDAEAVGGGDPLLGAQQ